MTDHFNIAIIGSGPAGLSASAHAAKKGLEYISLEKSDRLSDTTQHFQKGKFIMSAPDVLALRADIPFAAGKKEGILSSWEENASSFDLNIIYGADITEIKKSKKKFVISLSKGGNITANHVVLAIGLQGNINKMNVPGADLPHVQYKLNDPEEYDGETIVVIGAGDAAIENAIALSKQNSVIIINRRDEFARAKTGNLSAITKAIRNEDIQCFYNSSPISVPKEGIVLQTNEGEVAIDCHRIIAQMGASSPRKFVEACGVTFPSQDRAALPEVDGRYQSNVPGLYIIGALAGYPLIKEAINQGYDVIDHIMGETVIPADQPLLEERLAAMGKVDVDEVLTKIQTTIPIFHDLNPLILRRLMLDSEIHVLSPEDTVFERNDYTNTFFTILEGEVAIHFDPADPEKVFIRCQGEFFGEMELTSGRRRSETVTAHSKCILVEVSHREIVKLINSSPQVKDVLYQTMMARQIQTYLVPQLTTEELAETTAQASLETFKAGDVIFEQGEDGDSIHLVSSGSVTISRRIGGKETVMAYLSAGNYFGEMALLTDLPRTETVRAATNTETIRVGSEVFKGLVERLPDLKKDLEAKCRDRVTQTEQMIHAPEAGNIIQFLVDQGAGEASDILLIDESLCVHCNNCEQACAGTHGGVSRLNRESGSTYAHVHIPISCRHCEHPHCMADCPPDAIHRVASGEVFIDDKCIGCGNCTNNCPYGAIRLVAPAPPQRGLLTRLLFGEGKNGGTPIDDDIPKTAVKCDMCMGLKGGPACVRHCSTGAAQRVHPEEFMSVTSMAGDLWGQKMMKIHETIWTYARFRYLKLALFLCTVMILIQATFS